MAGSGGGSGGGAGGAGEAVSEAVAGAAMAPGKAGGTVKAGNATIIGTHRKSQRMLDGQSTLAAPPVLSEPPQDKGAVAEKEVVPLSSLGKGKSTAEVDPKTSEVVVRRSGRVVHRFASEAEIDEFVEKKRLSDVDREALQSLALVAEAKRRGVMADVTGVLGESAEQRKAIGAKLSPAAANPAPEMENSIVVERDKTRMREEIQRNDAEVYARVEKQRKQRVEPVGASTIAAARSAEAKSSDTIEREAPFASPNPRIKVIPSEVESQYSQVGNKFYHPNDTKTVAFVDRGDKLETPSSAPQMAQSLVKIAEARGWDDLKVKGTEGFRREIWLQASVRGIHVDGYKPSELDKLELEKRSTFMQDRNSVEVRSEALQKLAPQEGVSRDSSRANTFGHKVAAKQLVERTHPESRAAFIKSLNAEITRRDKAGELDPIKLKILPGQLIEHGRANYKFDKDEKPSYYVKLVDIKGRERVHWGAGLQKAIATASPQLGDTVQLSVPKSKGVVVEGNVRDAAGQVVGRQSVDSYRNEWQVTVIAKARSLLRQEPQRDQDRVR